jgi:hypothetical protein
MTDKPVLFLKANVAAYTRKNGVAVGPHTDSRPAGQWFLHHTSKDGVEEHRKIVATGKPSFRGSGTKMHRIVRHPGSHMEVYHAAGGGPALYNYDDLDEAKKRLGD